ncbi:MAG TPA: hypothetical protein PKA62_09890, partial [Thermoanaerobaculia bacterium]|nr:hypothetical protein [Thermoanaerobaculia bacterium]
MNRHIATSLLVLSLAIPPIAPRAEGARVTVSVSFFTSELEPWGRWVRVEPWGQVWVPGGVGPGWQPYLYGRWEMSDYGWAWVSADPWSPWTWHYGTWVPTARWGGVCDGCSGASRECRRRAWPPCSAASASCAPAMAPACWS